MNEELKQCPQCFTMKQFTGDICYRCLDRNEAKREISIVLIEKIEKDLEDGKFYSICSNESSFKDYIINLIKE